MCGICGTTNADDASAIERMNFTGMIAGERADEFFAGYPGYRWVTRAARLDRFLPRPAAILAAGMLDRVPAGRRAERLAAVVSPSPLLERQLEWVSGGRPPARSGTNATAGRSRPSEGAPARWIT